MEIYLQYGAMMRTCHLNISLRGLRISTQEIVSAMEDMGLFTRPGCQQAELLLLKNATRRTQDGEMADLKAFESEIHALADIRHRNIVKLYGYCSCSQNSFLVYEFMEKGSLRNNLSNKEGRSSRI